MDSRLNSEVSPANWDSCVAQCSHQLVQGVKQIRALTRLNDHLGGISIYLLHGIDIHSIAGHLKGAPLVLRQDGAKRCASPCALSDNLGFGGGRFLSQAGRRTNNPGNYIIRVSIGLILCPSRSCPALSTSSNRPALALAGRTLLLPN